MRRPITAQAGSLACLDDEDDFIVVVVLLEQGEEVLPQGGFGPLCTGQMHHARPRGRGRASSRMQVRE